MPPRYVCPPWYDCRCYGKPVSRTTMLAHRRRANAKRANMGRGKFGWGPRVDDSAQTEIEFECSDCLEEHPSDNENEILSLVIINGVAQELPSTDLQQLETTSPDQNDFKSDDPEVFLPTMQNLSDSVDPVAANMTKHDSGHDSGHDSTPPQILRSWQYQSGNQKMNGQTPESSAGEEEISDFSGEDMDQFDSVLSPAPNESDFEFLLSHGSSANMGVLEWVREHQVWVDLFNRHGLTLKAMDDVLMNLKAPFKCWKTAIANVCAKADLRSQIQVFATCPGHICFTSLSDAVDVEHCTSCGSPKPDIAPSNSVQYIPMLPRIQAILMEEQACNTFFQYHQTFQSEPDTYRDFFDSWSYQRICQMYGSKENVIWDVFIAASTDGFQAYKNRTLDVWPVLAIFLNLAPEERYNVKNVLPLMFIPGGCQPSHLQSFLNPLINEVNSTTPDGVMMKFYDGSVRRVRIHLVWFSTDLDALTKVASLTGHSGKTTCRFCLLQGLYSQSSRHYYFPCSICLSGSSRPTIRYNPASLPSRSSQSITSAIARVTAARTASERSSIAKETGIKGDSLMFALPNFIPYRSFPLDIMHLFYNIQKQLLGIQLSDMDDLFCVSRKEIEVLDNEILGYGERISGQLAASPRKLSLFYAWKAAEHKMFTLSYYMILFDGYIPERYIDCLEAFVSIVELCFRPVIIEDDIQELSKLSIRFIRQFEKNFMRHNPQRIKMSTYVIHLILHLAEGVRENGPLLNTSQYWVERYIGWIVDRLHARRLPAASFRNAALFQESCKMVFSSFLSSGQESEMLEYGESYRFLSPVRGGDIDCSSEQGPDMRRSLSSYLIRKYEGMMVREAENVARNRHVCYFWGRVRFRRNGYGAVQTAEVSSRNSRGRPSCFVATEMDSSDSGADVYYGKLLYLLEINLTIDDEHVASRFPHLKERHVLAVINWARPLSKGKQQQVFVKSSPDNAFSSPTLEDISIIRRLIGVVEHSYPLVPKERRGVGQRVQRRTYFIDSDSRQDYLLTNRKRSTDGVNRVLKGLSSSR